MIRLHVIAEGQTEETFVNKVLKLHLAQFNVFADVRCVETSRSRRRIYRGGLLDYGRAKRDIERWMKEDHGSDVRFTTLFDLYHLPNDFPRFEEAKRQTHPPARVEFLEQAFAEDLPQPRFVPYIQLHEFEALILSDPERMKREFIGREDSIHRLAEMSSRYESPELIDDGETTAPSKRIIAALPDYKWRKPTAGPNVARAIGLETLRGKCPHFSKWLVSLESLAQEDNPGE